VIPISQPLLDQEVEDEVLGVLRSGHISQGPKVAELESLFQSITGCEHAIAVSSGTVALDVALAMLELKPGDEVVTTPFTFGATLSSIIHSGATAVLVDVDDHGLIDLSAVLAHRTSRTRAVVPVHLYGLPVDLSLLPPDSELAVIEDAAQAIGAAIGSSQVGSYGLGCFSLYATKNVTTGEGGVLTTSNAELAAKARVLRNQGLRAPYEYIVPGHNYRMTDIQAAVGIPQLRRLNWITRIRTENAARLTSGLEGVPGLVLPTEPTGRKHVWHQFTVRVTDQAARPRDAVAALLRRNGIATGTYYPKVLADYPCFAEHPRVRTERIPTARRLAQEVLSLPVHPGLSPTDIDLIVQQVRHALSA
jgi:dTDP-4-amino-4,6-dideoxygalactose transaminase